MKPKPPKQRYHEAEGCDAERGDRVFHAHEFDLDTPREEADNQAVFQAFLAKVRAKRQKP